MGYATEISATCDKVGEVKDKQGAIVKPDETTTFGLALKMKQQYSYKDELIKILDIQAASIAKLQDDYNKLNEIVKGLAEVKV
jgi:uncharacterized protein YdcH (DUF465 family)